MKTTTKAIFAMAILALAAAIIVVPADASDAADDRTLTVDHIDYMSGMIGVYVDKDVSGKYFSGEIDGVTQSLQAAGQDGKLIIIKSDKAGIFEKLVL